MILFSSQQMRASIYSNFTILADADPNVQCDNTDTGGTCNYGACDGSRGPTVCKRLTWHSSYKCFCQPGYCAAAGSCALPYTPLTSTQCGSTDTGGTCRVLSCHSWRNSFCDNGKCMCGSDYCARDGMCTVAVVEPVLAATHSQSFGYFKDLNTLPLLGYVNAMCRKSTDGCKTAEFPGDCQSVFRWQDVVNSLEAIPQRQKTGEIIRGNDLGFFILNSHLWERDVRTISLGLTVEEHEFTRPILDKILGSQSKFWSADSIQRSFDSFMTGKTKLEVPGDIATWTQKILHEIHLGIYLSDEEVAEITSLQMKALGISIMPAWRVIGDAIDAVSHGLEVQNMRAKWLDKYREAIRKDTRGVYPTDMTSEQVFLLATSFLDSLLFAGGLSVQSIITVAMAVIYSDSSPLPASDRALSDPDSASKLVWETIRHFPAVVGFSWWQGEQRHAVGLSMALRDPEVWGATMDEFRLRNLADYETYGPVAWAQPANGPGWRDGALQPMSRGCPGQQLSYVMATTFLKSWLDTYRSDFTCSNPSITFLYSTPWVSGFTLEKTR